jgi:hypothetical protein
MRIFAEESFWLRMTTLQGRGIRPLWGTFMVCRSSGLKGCN